MNKHEQLIADLWAQCGRRPVAPDCDCVEARAARELERIGKIADALVNHCDKEGGECSVCSRICCPEEDPNHFHHDGCPSCCQMAEVGYRT